MTTVEIERAIANVRATLSVEELKASEESEEITRMFLAGSLTSGQAIEKIKNLHGCGGG